MYIPYEYTNRRRDHGKRACVVRNVCASIYLPRVYLAGNDPITLLNWNSEIETLALVSSPSRVDTWEPCEPGVDPSRQVS
jgi:hypothetical protein